MDIAQLGEMYGSTFNNNDTHVSLFCYFWVLHASLMLIWQINPLRRQTE